ncbi:unnamed protein product [Paramecium sonneborni]|uniref:Sodium/calcium exchanger membrane region domain-containing protein n=1 Tax=Paramecium sonneborni TaxID=65129 RepID=A0A8S1KX92_9CILI|nr:unnamed protein product [Paramecium sonneborni]
MSCDSSFFFSDSNLEEKCQLANSLCAQNQIFINYYSIIYCQLNGHWAFFIAIAILVVLIIFRFMSTLVMLYLTPAIEFITDKLNISQSLSAVTLLALANGAGDVVTAIVATETLDGISYNIGSLYGAGFFVATLVVSITIINSQTYIVMKSYFIWRDILFYIFATIVVIIYGIIGELSLIDSSFLLIIYFILIIVVIFQDKFSSKSKKQFDELLIDNPLDPNETQESEQIQQQSQNLHLDSINNQQSCADKSFCVVDVPFRFILKYSIPPSTQVNKYILIFTIFPSLSFIYFVLGSNNYDPYAYLYISSISMILAIIIYTSYPQGNDLPNYYLYIQIYITIVSLVWIYCLSGILIDTLTFFGMLTNLSNSYLGMTIIAMGNALPDGIVTMTLAKQGYAVMGITGAYFGQIFGLLVGLGISLIKTNLKTGASVKFDLFNQDLMQQNLIMIIIIFSTLFVLIITFFYGILKKYHFARDLSVLLILIYVLVLSSITIIAIYEAV